ncbi:integrase/recombinase XerC [Mitsuaria sp. PDC51]|nr:integrase/recombinase XerC [Mitsuaria sp. PDC51]
MAITIAPKTAKFHSEQTMKRRVSTVSNLYRWAARVHFCKWDDSNDELLLQKASTSRGARYFKWPDCSSKQDAYRIKGLLKDEAKEIFKKLGERPTKHEQAWKDFGQGVSKSLPPSAKDRLAAEMALNAGLRVFECTRLKLGAVQKYLDDIENIVATKLYPVDIKGKGGKTLPTNFSGALLLQIAAYVRGERACCNPRCDTVLVNPPHYGPSLMGRQCTTRTLEKRFSEACIALGVLREEEYFAIGDDGRYESTPRKRKCPKYVFHDLRHTFAFWTYLARRWTDAEPWKYVSEQLRHASIETTLKIYLAHINAYEAIVSDDFLESFKTRRGGAKN